jgi:4-amino-4-deoxy-L-arabinose transferase-like glycosyltransferase
LSPASYDEQMTLKTPSRPKTVRASRFWMILGLTVVALVARFTVFAYDPHPFRWAGLADVSADVAEHLLAGEGFVQDPARETAIVKRQVAAHRLIDIGSVPVQPGAYTRPLIIDPPGEAVVLAGIWAVTGTHKYVYLQLLQLVLDAAMVPLVFFIALRLFRRYRTALLAAAAYALWVPAVRTAVVPYMDIWAMWFTLAITASWLMAIDGKHRWRWLAATGLLTGIGLEFRPGVGLLLPALALAAIPWIGWRRAATSGVVTFMIAGALAVPWTLRNLETFHRFVPFRTGVGQNLWEGLGEIKNNFGAILDDRITYNQVHAVRPELQSGTLAYDSYLQEKAVVAIREHPGHETLVVLRRIVLATFGITSLIPSATLKSLSYLEAFLFLFAIMIAMATRRRFPHQHLLLVAVLVGTMMPYVALHLEVRYMFPAYFAYLLWASLGVDLVLERLRGSDIFHLPRSWARKRTRVLSTARTQ